MPIKNIEKIERERAMIILLLILLVFGNDKSDIKPSSLILFRLPDGRRSTMMLLLVSIILLLLLLINTLHSY